MVRVPGVSEGLSLGIWGRGGVGVTPERGDRGEELGNGGLGFLLGFWGALGLILGIWRGFGGFGKLFLGGG